MKLVELEPADVADEKGRQALAQYAIEELGPEDRDRFDEAYRILDAEFGARGELERREVIEKWIFGRSSSEPKTYYLLVARDREGRIAAVRDCHVRMAKQANVVVAYLAHVIVLPEHRRTGLGAVMRAAPIALARRVASASPGMDILIAAEMEPVEPNEEATRIRLVAYGRAGFKAIEPSCLPYCQPDFRDLTKVKDTPKPLPLLAVVRWLENEDRERLPKRFAAAYVEVLYAVFGTHCREEDMAPLRKHTLDALAAAPGEDVPLITLPAKTDDLAPFAPLLRDRVLALHP